MPEGVVRDRPDRPQRGLMVDIARKYFTAGLDRGPAARDGRPQAQPARPALLRRPGLPHRSRTRTPRSSRAQHLTKAEVRRIVDLAARLHITVIPEIDSPGHLGAVLAAHPAAPAARRRRAGRVRGAIDIAKPASARIVDELLREYAELFPGAYWHLGGDEYQALVRQEPGGVLPAAGGARPPEVRPAGTGPGPGDGLGERPRGGGAPAGQEAQGVERRLLPRRRGHGGQGHRGRVLDRQGDRGPAAAGVSARGPAAGQPQRRVPLLRARRAATTSSTRPAAGSTSSGPRSCCAAPSRCPRKLLGPDPGRPLRGLVRPRQRPDPGPGGTRHRDAAAGDVPEAVGPAASRGGAGSSFQELARKLG